MIPSQVSEIAQEKSIAQKPGSGDFRVLILQLAFERIAGLAELKRPAGNRDAGPVPSNGFFSAVKAISGTLMAPYFARDLGRLALHVGKS